MARSGSLGFICGVNGIAKDDARARTQAARDEAERESRRAGERARELRRIGQLRAARREQMRADCKRIAVLKQDARFKALLVEQARLNEVAVSHLCRPAAFEDGARGSRMKRSVSDCVLAVAAASETHRHIRRMAKNPHDMSDLLLSPTHVASGMRRVGSVSIPPLNQLE